MKLISHSYSLISKVYKTVIRYTEFWSVLGKLVFEKNMLLNNNRRVVTIMIALTYNYYKTGKKPKNIKGPDLSFIARQVGNL